MPITMMIGAGDHRHGNSGSSQLTNGANSNAEDARRDHRRHRCRAVRSPALAAIDIGPTVGEGDAHHHRASLMPSAEKPRHCTSVAKPAGEQVGADRGRRCLPAAAGARLDDVGQLGHCGHFAYLTKNTLAGLAAPRRSRGSFSSSRVDDGRYVLWTWQRSD